MKSVVLFSLFEGKIPAKGREITGKANDRLPYLFKRPEEAGFFARKAVKKSGKENKVKKPWPVNGFLYFQGPGVFVTLSRFAFLLPGTCLAPVLSG